MGAEQENTARLKAAWAKWSDTKGADIMMWKDIMTDDVKLFSLADGDERIPFTAAKTGFAQVQEYLEGLVAGFSMNLWQIDQTVAEGDRVVGIGRTGWTSKATGRDFVTPIVIVTRWRDGKMCEYGEYYDTAKVAASTV